jgi:hypothetical protein
METLITFAGVTVLTLFALFAALALQSLLLKATFLLMAPAGVDRTSRSTRVSVEQGTRLLAHAYGRSR